MKKYKADAPGVIYLGKQGENHATTIAFDCKDWIDRYGPGQVQLLHRRCGETDPYPVLVHKEGDLMIWDVSNVDTSCPGKGEAQLLYFVDSKLAKSSIATTNVQPGLSEPGPVPDAQQFFLDQVTAQAARAEAAVSQTSGDRQEARAAASEAKTAAEKSGQSTDLALQHKIAAGQAAERSAAAAELAEAEANRSIGLGLTGGQEGDMVQIKNVDAQGKPTAWQIAAQKKWELIEKIVVPDGPWNPILRTTCPNGEKYDFSGVLIKVMHPGAVQKSFNVQFALSSDETEGYETFGYVTSFFTEKPWDQSYSRGVVLAKPNVGISLMAQNSSFADSYSSCGIQTLTVTKATSIKRLAEYAEIPPKTEIEIWAVRV